MPTLVPYPDDRPVPVEFKRSRRPLIVLGPRGPRLPKGRWSVEEAAILNAQQEANYPAWYLGPKIELGDPSSDADLGVAFRRLYALLAGGAGLEIAGVCVPRWNDLPQVARERVHVAVGHQVRADFGASATMSAFRLEPRGEALRLIHAGTRSTPRANEIGRPRSFVMSPRNHLDFLNAHLPTVDEVVTEMTLSLGAVGPRYRTFAAARELAEGLRRDGWSRPDIARYLEVFGYRNSKGFVGVWPEKRLKEVVEVAR